MKQGTEGKRRGWALIGALALAVAILAVPGTALAKKTTIVETTPQGYAMTLKVKGSAGKLRISCPNGTSLGAAKFTLKDKSFKAGNRSWRFSGRLDKSNHFTGTGSTKGAKCGAVVPTSFSEPIPNLVTWTACPTGFLAAGTPFTFRACSPGRLWGPHCGSSTPIRGLRSPTRST
jgi:hypothetical protein